MIFSFFFTFSSREQRWLLTANSFSLFQLGCYISESSLKMLFTEGINQSILHMLIFKHSGLSHQRVFIKKTCYKIKLTISQVNCAFDQEHATSENLLGNLLIWSYDEWLFWDQGKYLVNFLETYCIVSNKIMAFLFFYQSTFPKSMGDELLWANLFLYNIFEHHLIGTKLCNTSVFVNQKHQYFIYFNIHWLSLICESSKSYKSKFTKLLVLISFKYFIIYTLHLTEYILHLTEDKSTFWSQKLWKYRIYTAIHL